MTLVLSDEVDASRGNMLVAPGARPFVADQFQAHVIWFDANPMMPGRSYILRTETDSVSATVTTLKHQVNINSFIREAAKSLQMNEVGVCNISTQAPIAFDAYNDNRATGNFIIVDRVTNATVGAGLIDFPLRRADNVHWHALEVNKSARSAMKNQLLPFSGSPGFPAPENRPSRTSSTGSSTLRASILTCSTATMCVTASTGTSALPRRTG